MPKRLNGYFAAESRARKALSTIKKEDGFGELNLDYILSPREERLNSLKNAYAGNLPGLARGVLGSDIAMQGKSYDGLYDVETAHKAARDKEKELTGVQDGGQIWRVTCVATQEERFDRFEQIIVEYGGFVHNEESGDR